MGRRTWRGVMRGMGLKPPPTLKTMAKHAILGKPSGRRKAAPRVSGQSVNRPPAAYDVPDTQPLRPKGKRGGCFSWPVLLGGFLMLWVISVLFPSETAQRNREATQAARTAQSVAVITQPATSTPRLSATRQIETVAPTTPTINPNLPVQEREDVRDAWLLVDGVVGVDVAMLTGDEFYGEVRVADGLVTADMAASLRGLTPGGGFSVILDDGAQAVAFDWDAADERFRETALSIVAPSYTPSTRFSTKTPVATGTAVATNAGQASSASTTTSGTGQTYTVLNFANVRSCTNTGCQIVVGLAGGTQVTVTGSEDGASVSGSTQWYSVRLRDGRTGYVHSSLVREGIIFVAATSAPAGGSGAGAANTSVPPAGPTSFVCPRNCEGAVAMGLSPQQAATCPGLDRDKDGVACYGD